MEKEYIEVLLEKYQNAEEEHSLFGDVMYLTCQAAIEKINPPRIVDPQQVTPHDKYIAYLEMISLAYAYGLEYKNDMKNYYTNDFKIYNTEMMTLILTFGLYIRILNEHLTDQDVMNTVIKNCHWRTIDVMNVYFIICENFTIPEYTRSLKHPLTTMTVDILYVYRSKKINVTSINVYGLFDVIITPSGKMKEDVYDLSKTVYRYLYDSCLYTNRIELLDWLEPDNVGDRPRDIPGSVLSFLYAIFINDYPVDDDLNPTYPLYTLNFKSFDTNSFVDSIRELSEALLKNIHRAIVEKYNKLMIGIMEDWSADIEIVK